MKRFKLSQLLLAISLAFTFVAIPLISPKVSAIGEEYNWESEARVIACKSGFDTCVVFNREGGAVPGGKERFIVNLVPDFSFRGCKIAAKGGVLTVNPDGKTGSIAVAPFVTTGGPR